MTRISDINLRTVCKADLCNGIVPEEEALGLQPIQDVMRDLADLIEWRDEAICNGIRDDETQADYSYCAELRKTLASVIKEFLPFISE